MEQRTLPPDRRAVRPRRDSAVALILGRDGLRAVGDPGRTVSRAGHRGCRLVSARRARYHRHRRRRAERPVPQPRHHPHPCGGRSSVRRRLAGPGRLPGRGRAARRAGPASRPQPGPPVRVLDDARRPGRTGAGCQRRCRPPPAHRGPGADPVTAGEVRTGGTTRPDRGGQPGGRPARSYRAAARLHGAVAALNRLHTDLSPGLLPAGPAATCSCRPRLPRCATTTRPPTVRGAGPGWSRCGWPRSRWPAELTALRIAGAGPAGGPDAVSGWQLGLAWYRLGLADRLLSQVVRYLRGRSTAGTVLIDLPLVRAMLADAVSGAAEACALLDAGVTAASLRQVHRALSEAGRGCLDLFGAAGFLVDGPGSEIRASELLADTYAPPTETEWPR